MWVTIHVGAELFDLSVKDIGLCPSKVNCSALYQHKLYNRKTGRKTKGMKEKMKIQWLISSTHSPSFVFIKSLFFLAALSHFCKATATARSDYKHSESPGHERDAK